MASIGDYQIDLVENSWTVVAQATNAIATATKAATVNMSHIACKIDASYSSSAQDGELVVSFGATVMGRKHIHGAGAIDFGVYGLQAIVNTAITAVLDAGGAAVVGDVTLTGYTSAPKGGNVV